MLSEFKILLDSTGEIGYVEEIHHSVVYASGLPDVRPEEVIVFENNELGVVLSIERDYVEILLITSGDVKIGTKLARTNSRLLFPVGEGYLGRAIDPLGKPIDNGPEIVIENKVPVDGFVPSIDVRENIVDPLETGVAMVDMVVPLAKGQRELVIGDRNTGKSQFLLQTLRMQAFKGSICIYALIGQKQIEIKRLIEYVKANKISDNVVIIATRSSDPSGIIFFTPYSAMTLAEYFRDQGKDVLLILDDLTTHARNYREISLLARRFPGRNSYPGDIFYIHSRLLERAGNFKTGSITCLPGAESVMGDLSGYIQTNIMAMTDGHIFFDIDLYTKGRRPAVNPFLSVTRVGHQPQTPLQKDISRQLSSFLIQYEKMSQFLHFGAEVGENVKRTLDAGDKLLSIFNQSEDDIIPIGVNILLVGGLWAGFWKADTVEDTDQQAKKIVNKYLTDTQYKKRVDEFVSKQNKFLDLINTLRQNDSILKLN